MLAPAATTHLRLPRRGDRRNADGAASHHWQHYSIQFDPSRIPRCGQSTLRAPHFAANPGSAQLTRAPTAPRYPLSRLLFGPVHLTACLHAGREDESSGDAAGGRQRPGLLRPALPPPAGKEACRVPARSPNHSITHTLSCVVGLQEEIPGCRPSHAITVSTAESAVQLVPHGFQIRSADANRLARRDRGPAGDLAFRTVSIHELDQHQHQYLPAS
jgi:hypothetical protein